MNLKKDARRQRVIERLNNMLLKEELPQTTIDRIKTELGLLLHYLSGGKKKKKQTIVDGVERVEDRWYIDIFRISYSKVKRSERRKNKGKSRKKLRTLKSVSFVKTVVLQPGMMQAYRDGRMGISPREHSFRTRKDEPSSL